MGVLYWKLCNTLNLHTLIACTFANVSLKFEGVQKLYLPVVKVQHNFVSLQSLKGIILMKELFSLGLLHWYSF